MSAEAGLCQPDAVRLLHLHAQPSDQLTGKEYWSVLLCQEMRDLVVQVMMMSSLQHFFSFHFGTACGIPAVELRGSRYIYAGLPYAYEYKHDTFYAAQLLCNLFQSLGKCRYYDLQAGLGATWTEDEAAGGSPCTSQYCIAQRYVGQWAPGHCNLHMVQCRC